MVKRLFPIFIAILLISCSGGSNPPTEEDKKLDISAEGEIGFVESQSNSFTSHYRGSIGGIIAGADMISTDEREIIVWGVGASLRWGTIDSQLGSAILSQNDTITTVTRTTAGEIIFGTERGIGLAGFDSSGSFGISIYKNLENGISTSALANDGYVYLIDTAGRLLRTNRTQLKTGTHLDLIKEPTSWTENETWYPIAIAAGSERLAVILQNSEPMPALALKKEPVQSILKELAFGEKTRQVRIVGETEPVTYNFENESSIPALFARRSEFIPSGITFDENRLIVAGVAYDPLQIDVFVESKCVGRDDLEECLWEEAIKIPTETESSLLSFKDGNLDTISGRLIELNAETKFVSKTKAIYYKAYAPKPAPSLVMTPAINGGNLYLRGTSFLLILEPDLDGWNRLYDYGQGTAKWGQVTIGWPRSLVPDIQEGALATAVQPNLSEEPAFSTIEHIAGNLKRTIDTTSQQPELLDATSNDILIIEKKESTGGDLYLASFSKRTSISPNISGAYHVMSAKLDNNAVAYVYAREDNSSELKLFLVYQSDVYGEPPTQHTPIQRGDQITVSSEPFYDFPTVTAENTTYERDLKQKIADLKWSDGKLYALFHGFKDDKHYFRVGSFTISNEIANYGNQSGILTVAGNESFNAMKILKISNDTIYFSAPDGIYTANCDDSVPTKKQTPITKLQAITIRDDNVTAIDNDKVVKFPITGGTGTHYTLSGSTLNSSIAFLSSGIFVSLPDAGPKLLGLSTNLSANISADRNVTVASVPGESMKSALFIISENGLIEVYQF